MELPLYPTTVVGSWPRSRAVLMALKEKRADRMTEEEFTRIADTLVLEVLKIQEDIGLDIVSDGEQRRDNFISFVADKLDNVSMLTVAELLDYVEDKASFEEILGTLDVPAYSLSNPAAIGPIERKQPIALNEFLFLKKHTNKAIKIALPGPYLLTRSMWVEGLSQSTYPTKESLAEDVVRILREELDELIQAGVDFVQFDEPVLTELVFTQKNANRTFMCGALTAKVDKEEELDFATDIMNQVVKGMKGNGTRIGVHVCRGNWSTNESILLKGPYSPLVPYLKRMDVDQLILEYATPRAGEIEVAQQFEGKELGLGAVNPRTEEIESVEQVVERAKKATQLLSADRIFLNPDCGFGTFAQRPMNDIENATKKLQTLVQAANILRKEKSLK